MRYIKLAMAFVIAIGWLFPANAFSRSIRTIALADFAAPTPCSSQPIVASALHTPVKLIFTQQGNLLVAEMGFSLNNGRISIVDPVSGHRRTLVDGLPSDVTSGPSGLAMRGRTLYVTIGGGDSTLPGGGRSSRVPNPNPSSPIFSSVLAIDFTPQVEQTTRGFTLTWADHWALQNGAEINLDNGGGDKIKVRLLADLTDYTPEPRADEPNNVRPSDPFGLVIAADQLYISDYDSNSVRVVDLQSGEATTLTTFAPLASGRFVAEAAPGSIRFFGDQLLVPLSTNYPFPTGESQVWLVDPLTGSAAPFISGLTTAIDMLPIRERGHASEFLTLELSADTQAGRPGRLRRYTSPDAAPIVVANCLNSPTSMARDERTGVLYVTEIFTGRIVKVVASEVSGSNSVFGFEPQLIAAAAQ